MTWSLLISAVLALAPSPAPAGKSGPESALTWNVKDTGYRGINPVIAADDEGFLWIFSTSHGTSRPSYIHRSKKPYNIDEFEKIPATKVENGREGVPMTHFSYMQPWFLPGRGFVAPGGEVVVWTSHDQGATWEKVRQLTEKSLFNHTYVRQPRNAHDGFYAFWADGHGREPSRSSLYFCRKTGDVFRLPRSITEEFADPEKIN